MTKIVFLGPLGTYSHQAVIQQFGDSDNTTTSQKQKYELIPASTIPNCFDILYNDKSIDYAVVPFENSTNGQVAFTYDLLRDWISKKENNFVLGSNEILPPLFAIAEQYVNVEHCLISPIPLDSIPSHFQNLYSHPQVWGQINEYMNSKLNGKFDKRIDTTSTADGIKQCIKDYNNTDGDKILSLAIGSRIGAMINNAYIIESGINDLKGNTTRFLILQRNQEKNVCNSLAYDADHKEMVSLMLFTIKKNVPGCLVEVLNILKDYGINMTSISSRPSGKLEQNWEYVFYIEYIYDPSKPWKTEIYPKFNEKCISWCVWGIFNRNPDYYK
ncbi:related to Putative prephenate dehydratase [Saccharomycodes ludwigii]|uniref:prephenate dehydratase n=1 Tax=Saccharomycodes ludwigii TaxID=36035 RepID=A0A376BBW3_9ASCO|nr:hypothetical protein SCDLUD_005008 [Saccharomycodes ludwigii]KAH3898685.1 hypothetical protein SCDLUD_005008 [Saccharomycodes ludwigii]SSD62117.1 related to Putative prephenate dehydratase [Saccharomycodes ludwigii]